MTELLPAEPDKNGFYWVTIDPSDPFADSLWRWDAELRWWTDEDVRHWPAEAYADGWRLAWPDAIPTVDQLKATQPLTERQPIATAPRDGTVIDLWYDNKDIGELDWFRWPECKWVDGHWQYYEWQEGCYFHARQDATHWTAILD